MELDPIRVQQAVGNVLRNAIKFTEAPHEISVKSSISRDGWRIVIQDKGIGIPAAELEQIREPFYRGSNANRLSVRGTGLGLHIVDLIMDSHGGTMKIRSKENEGTEVELFFLRRETNPSEIDSTH
jgi:signal transduction histidine kinase